MRDTIIPVIFSTDNNFFMPTYVALKSMLVTSRDSKCYIYILHDTSFSEDNKRLLYDLVNDENREINQFRINYISMGDEFIGSYENRGITHPCYFRLLIPWLLPQYDKVIYCDGDVVFRKSISLLYNIDIGDAYCGGVKRYLYDGYSYKRHSSKLGLRPEDYINTGVLIMNSKKIRQDNLKDSFVRLTKFKYKYFDQDIINIVCYKNINSLPFEFNVTPTMDVKEDDIAIIHYAGLKPWNHFVRRWYYWWDVYYHSSIYCPDLEKKIVDNPIGFKNMLKVWLKGNFPGLYVVIRNKFFT